MHPSCPSTKEIKVCLKLKVGRVGCETETGISNPVGMVLGYICVHVIVSMFSAIASCSGYWQWRWQALSLVVYVPELNMVLDVSEKKHLEQTSWPAMAQVTRS